MHVVVVPFLLLAVLVLNGIGDFDQRHPFYSPSRRFVEFDDVGASIESQASRGDPKSSFGADRSANFSPGAIGSFMVHFAAERVLVVDVESVEMAQRRSSLAIEQGVEGG